MKALCANNRIFNTWPLQIPQTSFFFFFFNIGPIGDFPGTISGREEEKPFGCETCAS